MIENENKEDATNKKKPQIKKETDPNKQEIKAKIKVEKKVEDKKINKSIISRIKDLASKKLKK